MSTINLLPEDYIERRAQQRANVLCLILFGVVMAGVVAAAVVSEEQARRVRQTREQVNERYRQASQLIGQIEQLQSKKRQVIAKAQMAAELLERVPRSYLLASLTNALPPGGSLTRVKLETKQPRPKQRETKAKSKFRARAIRQGQRQKQAKIDRPPLKVTLEVDGLAETDVQVARFIANVQNNPLMKSVELVFSEEKEIDDVMVRSFRITMELKPGAEVEIAKSGGRPNPAGSQLATTIHEGPKR